MENIARMIQPGEENYIDPDWYKAEPDDSLSGKIETWVMELTYHAAGAPVLNVARDIVRESYASGCRSFRIHHDSA